MYAHGEACRPDQDREDIGAYCLIYSMVWEPYDGIIGDAPLGRSRSIDCSMLMTPSGVTSTQPSWRQ